MKSKNNFAGICTLLLCLCFSKNLIAQQLKVPSPNNITHNGQPVNTYTYKVFEAPNKMYGYDILQNGKGIFHQPAAIIPTNNAGTKQNTAPQTLSSLTDPHSAANGFSKEEFAQNAARLSIEKIKKRSAPALTNDEMKQAINTNSNTIIKH